MTTYLVTSYNVAARPAYDGRRTIIDATSAEAAVHAVLRSPAYASKTRRWQRHPDAAVRDNAYFQTDHLGWHGAAAIRVEFDGEEKRLDAESAAAPARGNNALSRAGYAIITEGR